MFWIKATAPCPAPTGEVVEVGWTSDIDNDLRTIMLRITLARPDDPDFTWIDSKSTEEESPQSFTMPDQPGIYELRLLDMARKEILSRATIEVR